MAEVEAEPLWKWLLQDKEAGSSMILPPLLPLQGASCSSISSTFRFFSAAASTFRHNLMLGENRTHARVLTLQLVSICHLQWISVCHLSVTYSESTAVTYCGSAPTACVTQRLWHSSSVHSLISEMPTPLLLRGVAVCRCRHKRKA